MSLEWLTCATWDIGGSWGGGPGSIPSRYFASQDLWDVNAWETTNLVIDGRTGKGIKLGAPGTTTAGSYTGHIITRDKDFVGYYVALKHPGGVAVGNGVEGSLYGVVHLTSSIVAGEESHLVIGYSIDTLSGTTLTHINWCVFEFDSDGEWVATHLSSDAVAVPTAWTLLSVWRNIPTDRNYFYWHPDGGSEVAEGFFDLDVEDDGHMTYRHAFTGAKGASDALIVHMDDLASCHGDAVGERPAQGEDTLHGKVAVPDSSSPDFCDLDGSSLPEFARITRLSATTGNIEAKCEDPAFNVFALSNQASLFNAEGRAFEKTPDDTPDPWNLARFNALQAQMQGSNNDDLVAQAWGRNLTVLPPSAPSARRIFITHN